MENETPDYEEIERLIPSQAREIKAILKDKYGLAVPIHCDEFIKRCLRLKDGNKEKAIKLIKAFHAAVQDVTNWDATLSPSLYENFYRQGACQAMLKKDDSGRRVCIIRTRKWDPQKMNFDEAVAGLWLMCQYINAEFRDVQRNGFVTVWDFSGFSLQQAWAVKQWRVLTVAKWIQNSVAGRIKAFHAIFHPRIVGVIYSGIKPFLKEKLRKRIIFHDSLDSLHKYVAPELLPESLGGDLKNDEGIDMDLIKEVLAQDDFFKAMIENGFPEK